MARPGGPSVRLSCSGTRGWGGGADAFGKVPGACRWGRERAEAAATTLGSVRPAALEGAWRVGRSLGRLREWGRIKGSLMLALGPCPAQEARTAKTYSAEVCFLGDGIPFWV